MNEPLTIALWVVFPYLCLLLFVGGHVWRYRYDNFGWTSRSSQLHESKLLRWASPLFHFGILVVIAGHVIGLGIPNTWTGALGISADVYHTVAVTSGWIAGTATVVGLAMLIYRRRTTGAVFYETTPMDKFMYVVLGTVIALGMWSLMATTFDWNNHYDYREGVSIWFRGLFFLDLRPELMTLAPLNMQLHALAGFAIFALWPFTRLVHVFSAPVWYIFRPYVVYRSRKDQLGSRATKRGWDRVGTRR
ncbi:MAG: respiratory nitrate reductase subunit gamma [Actinobacteria bacterium HGW-Actinobacteria-4]|nr:MAG: respiratory nitrate reductase subunit gamma [Actinobacteria bacterium HGW-Actinobacteria-4]